MRASRTFVTSAGRARSATPQAGAPPARPTTTSPAFVRRPVQAHWQPHSRPRRRRALPVSLFLLTLACLFLLHHGWPYYRLEMIERVHSPLHEQLKPSGTIGLLYGYLGAACLFLLLTYAIHKRVRFLQRLWRVGRTLDFHILCGFAGPAFITLHAGFRFGGAIAVGYWAMVCVMVSGCVGFYLYRNIAHALSHNVGEQRELQGEIDTLDRELVEYFHVTPAHLDALRRVAGVDRAERMGVFTSLLFLVAQDLTLGARLAWVNRRYPEARGLGRLEGRRLHRLLRQRVVLARRVAFLQQARALFGYWHAFHKPFAIVLYVTIALHIGVAVWLGYAWAW